MILATCLFMPCLLGSTISFVLLAFLFLVLPAIPPRDRASDLHYVLLPLAYMFALGLLGLLSNVLYNGLKDAWYLLKIALLLTIGYYLMGMVRIHLQLYRAIVLAGIFAAVLHLIEVIFASNTADSLLNVRLSGITGYIISAIALAVLLGHGTVHRRLGFSLMNYLLMLGLCSASLALSLSRTYLISFIVLLVVLWVTNLRRLIALLVFVSLAVAIGGVVISPPEESLTPATASVWEKLLNTVTEVKVSDYEDLASINDKWRGFEAFKALSMYLDYNIVKKLLGGGFGALVDLGFTMQLNGIDFESIPMLHNGYLYILIKYGGIGMLLFIVLFLRMWRITVRGQDKETYQLKRLLGGVIVVTLLCTFVVTGIFNKDVLDSVTMLMGAMLYGCSKNARSKHSSTANESSPDTARSTQRYIRALN